MIKTSKFAPRPLQARAASMPSALILCLMLLICAAPSAFGQKGTWRDGIDLIMRSVEDLNQKGASFKLTALPDASSGNWPGSFYAWRNGFRCSATLIGPKALLLPAQCMPDGSEVVIEFRGVRKAGTCKHSGTSTSADQSDFALCVLTTPIEGIQFDTVNLNAARIRPGSGVFITSFSDCKEQPFNEPFDGRFRIREGVVVARPRERGQDSNAIVVRGNACPSDDGGIAYIILEPKRRLVVGVSYRASEKSEFFISSLSTNDAQAFFRRWAQETGTSVCGVNYEGSNCR
jgi:hypothetical protein